MIFYIYLWLICLFFNLEAMKPDNKDANLFSRFWNNVENFLFLDEENLDLKNKAEILEIKIQNLSDNENLPRLTKVGNLISCYKRLIPLYSEQHPKHHHYAKELHLLEKRYSSLKFLEFKKKLQDQINYAQENNNLHEMHQLYKVLQDTESDEKKQEYQQIIDQLVDQLEAQNKKNIVKQNHIKKIEELTADITHLLSDTVDPYQRIDNLAGLLEKRAFYYTKYPEFKCNAENDRKKAHELRLQIVAQSELSQRNILLRSLSH